MCKMFLLTSGYCQFLHSGRLVLEPRWSKKCQLWYVFTSKSIKVSPSVEASMVLTVCILTQTSKAKRSSFQRVTTMCIEKNQMPLGSMAHIFNVHCLSYLFILRSSIFYFT